MCFGHRLNRTQCWSLYDSKICCSSLFPLKQRGVGTPDLAFFFSFLELHSLCLLNVEIASTDPFALLSPGSRVHADCCSEVHCLLPFVLVAFLQLCASCLLSRGGVIPLAVHPPIFSVPSSSKGRRCYHPPLEAVSADSCYFPFSHPDAKPLP